MSRRPIKKCFLVFACLFFYIFHTEAQQVDLRISILTLEPGNEIYSIFGHTAIRITSESDRTDRVYNFGTFNFNDPAFYFKFVRGNLLYSLSVDDFSFFMQNARLEMRTVHEQVLMLNSIERKKLQVQLERIYNSPERNYRYDFIFNNCATKVRDCIAESNKDLISESSGTSTTYRQLIQPYIKENYWLTLGINLLMGPHADRPASSKDCMFLPESIYGALKNPEFAWPEETLLQAEPLPSTNISWFSPWVMMFLVISLTLIRKTRKVIFFVFLSAVGITGVLILWVDLISIQPIYSGNFNIWWTAPAIIPVMVLQKNAARWAMGIYLAIVIFALFFGWMLRQELSLSFIPWMLTLIIVLSVNLDLPSKISTFKINCHYGI